jgi:hypothetical protein
MQMPTPDDANPNPSKSPNDDDRGATDKAPIDRWIAGDLSTIDIIDNILGFFGIDNNSRKRHGEKDESG